MRIAVSSTAMSVTGFRRKDSRTDSVSRYPRVPRGAVEESSAASVECPGDLMSVVTLRLMRSIERERVISRVNIDFDDCWSRR